MKNNEYECIIAEAMNAKKPVRWVSTMILIAFPVVMIVSHEEDSVYASPVVFVLFLFYSMIFYEVIIERILEYMDIAYCRIIKFEGIVIGYEAYHSYRTLPAQGTGWLIDVKGKKKKKKLYAYDTLIDYIKRTRKSKWPLDLVRPRDDVEGVYLKHSKILIELNILNKPADKSFSPKHRTKEYYKQQKLNL